MIDITDIKIGDKVHYRPHHCGTAKWENGIVKELPSQSPQCARVVYHCGGDWTNYKNYTSALTHRRYLYLGWRRESEIL